jgi:hypothetical protein
MKNNDFSKKPLWAPACVTPEFKAEAVRLVEESGGVVSKIAREFDVYDVNAWELGTGLSLVDLGVVG